MKGPSPDKVSPSSAIVTMFTSIDAPVCDDDGEVYDGDNHTDDDDDDDDDDDFCIFLISHF